MCVAPVALERHHYRTKVTVTDPRLTNRLAKEFAGLASSLPLAPDGAVFTRMDATQANLWRVLITGPKVRGRKRRTRAHT